MNAAFIKPQWSPLTIALMVLGFVIFWPLGLAMLAYILWGEMFGGSSDKAEAWVSKSKAWCRDNGYRHNGYGNWRNSSGNAAFDGQFYTANAQTSRYSATATDAAGNTSDAGKTA